MKDSQPRWTHDESADWQSRVGWLVGCNFTPSTAGNQLEMWQAETFDYETISRELTWASDIGMNSIRLYLHDLLYRNTPNEFLQRLNSVLELAAASGIGVIPVLFDGVWNPKPAFGLQPTPIPRLHNSVWVQGPGSDIFYESSRWSELRPFVVNVLEHFKDDRRIIAWDLFNEPDQVDAVTLRAGSRVKKIKYATELVSTIFDWARLVRTQQPLTVGLWEYDNQWQPISHSLNSLILERSDIISFHCYEPRERLVSIIENLSVHKRPLLCTEWLARTAGSTVDLLEVFAEYGVGAVNWGLVEGKTQTRFPWKSWTEKISDDEPWFHELLHRDGSPYDSREIEIFKRLTASR